MIKNIIFDIGKVLVSYEPDIMMKDLGFDDDIIGRVNKALFENELWEQSDQGLFSPSEILQKAIDNDTDIKDYIVKAWENVGKSIARYDYVYDWTAERSLSDFQCLRMRRKRSKKNPKLS